MQANLRELQAAKIHFDNSFWQLLSPAQHARGLTATPRLYDVHAIGIAVGASPIGEPLAHTLSR